MVTCCNRRLLTWATFRSLWWRQKNNTLRRRSYIVKCGYHALRINMHDLTVSWVPLPINVLRCKSSVISSALCICQLFMESDKLVSWKGRQLRVDLEQVHPIGVVEENALRFLTELEHPAWVKSQHTSHTRRLWLLATTLSQTVHLGAFNLLDFDWDLCFGPGFSSISPPLARSSLCVAIELQCNKALACLSDGVYVVIANHLTWSNEVHWKQIEHLRASPAERSCRCCSWMSVLVERYVRDHEWNIGQTINYTPNDG